MGGKWTLQWSLLMVVFAEDAWRSQVRYLPHGIQMSRAPYPARRTLGFEDKPQPFSRPAELDLASLMKNAGKLQLFGAPLPGDNYSTTERQGMNHFWPGFMSKRPGDFGPYQMPDGRDFLKLDEPLVTRQALAPLLPRLDLSQLAQMPGVPPPGPLEAYRLSQAGNARDRDTFAAYQRARGLLPPEPDEAPGRGPMNPWSGLVPTAMGPYSRRLKPYLMRSPVERQPSAPLSPLRDIDDPKIPTSKVPAPYDTWLGAQQGSIVPPAPDELAPDELAPDELAPDELAPDELAPLAPPRMPGRNASRPRQAAKFDVQDYMEMMRNLPRFHETEATTRWQYQFTLGSDEEDTSRPPPELLEQGGGMMEELTPESNDESMFSDAAKTVKTRAPYPSDSFNYMLL